MWSSFYRSLFVLVLLLFVQQLTSATLLIEGNYQKKNILVHNSLAKSGVGYCAKEIRVNGKITSDETQSLAFEIDLSALNLKFGEKVVIEIIHNSDCRPKVLNPEDLFPKPTFEVLAMNLNVEGLLTWTTKSENGTLPFVIEQFKWNKWIPVAEVRGVGTPDPHLYSFQLSLHSGENKFRIKQKGYNSTVKYSKEVLVVSNSQVPRFTVNKEKVEFNQETAFEVYDVYGINLIKGFGKSINTGLLKSGDYYLCYDNRTIDFKK